MDCYLPQFLLYKTIRHVDTIFVYILLPICTDAPTVEELGLELAIRPILAQKITKCLGVVAVN